MKKGGLFNGVKVGGYRFRQTLNLNCCFWIFFQSFQFLYLRPAVVHAVKLSRVIRVVMDTTCAQWVCMNAVWTLLRTTMTISVTETHDNEWRFHWDSTGPFSSCTERARAHAYIGIMTVPAITVIVGQTDAYSDDMVFLFLKFTFFGERVSRLNSRWPQTSSKNWCVLSFLRPSSLSHPVIFSTIRTRTCSPAKHTHYKHYCSDYPRFLRQLHSTSLFTLVLIKSLSPLSSKIVNLRFSVSESLFNLDGKQWKRANPTTGFYILKGAKDTHYSWGTDIMFV